MAEYKVPQDVEAEDKLIGPFSFRQFIYLIVAALGIFLAWMLSQVFIGLLILPLPIVLAFLALALPLRKDQPMETYLIAMLKFLFKPRKRLWDPEGTISLVQITAPKLVEGPHIKEFGGGEASQRLAYLAQVADTRGWSTRGASSGNDSLTDIFIAEASHAEDVLDESSGVARSFEQKISESDDARLQAVRQQMQAVSVSPTKPTDDNSGVSDTVQMDEQTNVPSFTGTPDDDTQVTPVHYSPYPDSIHQRTLSPSGPSQTMPKKKAVTETVSPDIMRLANNNDLSISAIAREANRLKDNDEEVVISLR